jgi:predicted amidohydrolase
MNEMSTKGQFTLAAFQLAPSPTLKPTIATIESLISSVTSDTKPDCIVLPEYTFGTLREWKDSKQDSDKQLAQIQTAISALCRRRKVSIVAGSVPTETRDKRWRNRSYLFAADGSMVGSYDKQHPFRSEKLMGLEAGNQTPTFEASGLRVAVLICSDLWFPGLMRQVASKVDFVAVPTMTTVLNKDHTSYGRWTWHTLVEIRAKENVVPIVSADQLTREYLPGVYTCGASCVADPSCRFTANEGPYSQALRVATQEQPTAVVSTISTEAVRAYREYRRDIGLFE